ncbi:MAG: hypothetical protein ABIH46_03155, partial [Chloroflexota bacterium]
METHLLRGGALSTVRVRAEGAAIDVRPLRNGSRNLLYCRDYDPVTAVACAEACRHCIKQWGVSGSG